MRIEFEEALHAPVHRYNDDSDDDSDDPVYVPDDIETEQEARQWRQVQALSQQSLHKETERRRHGGAGPSKAGGSGSSQNPLPFRRSHSTRAAPTPPSPPVVPPRVNPVLQQDPHAYRKKGSKQLKIKEMWEDMKAYVGEAVSKWMLFHSIPTNATTGPYHQPMLDAMAEAGPGIKGPTTYEVMNVYLPKEKADLKAYIDELKVTWKSYRVTIMCDGWTGPTRKSIINFMVYCDGRTIFLTSSDASKERNDVKYIYKLLKDVVEEVGIQNVVQIVTDNGSNYKKARIKMMNNPRFQLFWNPCAAHCIDLMLKDMGKLKIVHTVVERARQVSTFVYDHEFSLNLLREKCRGDLVRPGLTRFATNYIALQSFESKKVCLRSMFASKEWFGWREAGSAGGREAQATISSKEFWRQLGKVVKILTPIVGVLKLGDSAFKPTLPSLWAAITMMKENVYATNPCGSRKFVEIIEDRWERQLSHPLHKAGKQS
ncbi:uncharacterized protein LOC122070102 [Macadamia integrifolia]|uniref:uncharacterized protein LOC122070102 n=1 Tax=Macadamia integrifolia TaxID=60698 RepID=UPI001C4FDA3D|nr:uncharacterized protein LOC122070102 [Macadamia integrifolia]